jgi:hypothetical protein
MERQLALLDPDEVDWRLDEHTCAVGREGIVAARQALREAARRGAGGAVAA